MEQIRCIVTTVIFSAITTELMDLPLHCGASLARVQVAALDCAPIVLANGDASILLAPLVSFHLGVARPYATFAWFSFALCRAGRVIAVKVPAAGPYITDQATHPRNGAPLQVVNPTILIVAEFVGCVLPAGLTPHLLRQSCAANCAVEPRARASQQVAANALNLGRLEGGLPL